jgi:hypothetical protein
VAAHSVFIKGGANVADKRLLTPRGVVTKITEEDLAALEQSSGEEGVWATHKRNGFITTSTSKGDPEVVAADMTTRDQAAPLVDEDFAPVNEGDARPTTLTSDDDNAPAAQAVVSKNSRKA